MRTARAFHCLVLALSACLIDARSSLGVKNAKVVLSSPDGLDDATYSLKQPEPLPSPIALTETSTFKLTFTVVDLTGSSVFPKQAHLLFEGIEDVTLPVSVKPNGRASFTLNTSKPPSALFPTHGNFSLTLLLSKPSYDPFAYPIGHISIPPAILKPVPRSRHDLPPRAGEPAFKAQEELFHTFQPEEKTVSWIWSVLGTGVTLSPWVVLLGLVRPFSPASTWLSPPTSVWPFLLCLTAIEVLTATYWVGLKIYQFLPYLLGMSLLAGYTGKVALGSLRQRRLQAGGKS
ncbi:hypothetical protein M231_06701 [Tremella mesenterica]|uniref:Ribophorin II C-terminal domain-containing protein n=1 Tax=Tremella mesenterica TaxID=5217 RepID=A0A4Q1BG74_TREME|nr:hypothetical protein M231_06701 [Tremella mesenterica]